MAKSFVPGLRFVERERGVVAATRTLYLVESGTYAYTEKASSVSNVAGLIRSARYSIHRCELYVSISWPHLPYL